jgi:hypothetical protein
MARGSAGRSCMHLAEFPGGRRPLLHAGAFFMSLCEQRWHWHTVLFLRASKMALLRSKKKRWLCIAILKNATRGLDSLQAVQ